MKRSVDRILMTHTGSLPRPPDLVELIFAREEGQEIDVAAFDERVRSAVAEVVGKQVECGLDVVNDGEMGRVSYATYVKDRLTGFGGESAVFGQTRPVPADMLDFPELAKRVYDPKGLRWKMPACDGPIEVRDREGVRRDVETLKAALRDVEPADAFMTAASPGVISLFLRNDYYPSHEAYLAAIADAMKHEYRAIAEAGLVLQVDCPDLAMGRHIQFGQASLEEFRRNARLHVEALNHALAGIPPEQVRIHLCWGNYEGPHHKDVALREIVDIVLEARAGAISLEACNPRHAHEWAVFEDVKLPEGTLLIPGVIDSTTNVNRQGH